MTTKQQQQLIDKIRNRKSGDEPLDLRGADLTNTYLSRANLYGADLSGADLTGADLTYANLTGANLSGANLFRANLYGANLTGAILDRITYSITIGTKVMMLIGPDASNTSKLFWNRKLIYTWDQVWPIDDLGAIEAALQVLKLKAFL